jgi:protein SCO1/2
VADGAFARIGGAAAVVAVLAAAGAAYATAPADFDAEAALRYSQAAIGRSVGDYTFLNRERKPVTLGELRGKPLIVNLIYTSCSHTCPLIAHKLVRAVAVAQDTLGADGFRVATIGFDVKADTPERMRSFAKSQGLNLPNWEFLSADAPTIDRLAEDLGFVFFASAKGFDHLAQISVLDANGKVYHHVYGDDFEPPQLVEPLKDLTYGRLRALDSWTGIVNRVKLFCTIYDPSLGRYRFDYRVVIMTVVSSLTMLGIGFVVVRAWVRHRRTSRHA